ncbi:hypothetical protein [Rhizobium rhizogenes]|uniref:hypothetical protein n=1 Tax=Rhizobium rhizogenes TaxID=359 RepID=UPI002270181E|nr:hypothetical protein [Rhizobium rhizogenes]
MVDDLKSRLNECLVSMASRGQLPNGDTLPPALWEELRQRLQRIYRKSTGETMAVLSFDNNPVAAIRSLAKAKEADHG